jgi:hypothetical protein
MQPDTPRVSQDSLEQPLPTGDVLKLDVTTPWAYLHHQSESGEFFLSSDTLNQSYGKNRHVAEIRSEIPLEELSRFRAFMYSIGNMIIFPSRQVGGRWTINQARGCHRQVGDRFDLTLECIRRYYRGDPNPLAATLARYADFFCVFGDFQGYVDFFLLHDLVTDDCSAVEFFLPFVDFKSRSPYPGSVDAFRSYLQQTTEFIRARNRRIFRYAQGMTIGDRIA